MEVKVYHGVMLVDEGKYIGPLEGVECTWWYIPELHKCKDEEEDAGWHVEGNGEYGYVLECIS